MGVAPVLPDEVALAAADRGAGERRTPMRTDRLGVLCLDPDTIEVLSHRGFDGEICRRIDRISCARKKCSREPAIGRKVERRATFGHDFAGVSGDETQLAGLPFELNDIQDEAIRLMTGCDE